MFNLIDSPGNLQSISSEICAKTHGAVLIYSTIDRSSFLVLESLLQKFLKTKGVSSITGLLVATKADIDDRQVTTAEGEDLARKFGFKFIEISLNRDCKDSISEKFISLGHDIRKALNTPSIGLHSPAPLCLLLLP